MRKRIERGVVDRDDDDVQPPCAQFETWGEEEIDLDAMRCEEGNRRRNEERFG